MSEITTSTNVISVGIVDDHRVLTDTLSAYLQHQPDLRVVGVAGTCAAARLLLRQTCPAVLLLDVFLPDGNGLSLVSEINQLCPNTHILVLTSSSDEKTLMQAIETGVNGFVSKNQPIAEVLAALRQAAEGEIVMPTSLLLGVLARVAHAPAAVQSVPNSITPREREILMCLAHGMSGARIAAQLNIAPFTVRTHIRNLMEKLGVHSRLEAVSYALRHGLIEAAL